MTITLTFPVWLLLGCATGSVCACIGFIVGSCFNAGKDKDTDMVIPALPMSCKTCRHSKNGKFDAMNINCGKCLCKGEFMGWEK